ncbi:alpha/beta fold hydrolase [Fodinicola feengrottensis]|uniref:alpha/beta fold hydrolase n=1 Tax=Fodinicola feengrottensis TaxID=435914 RepID=UPI0024420D43|nr:alpha/beta fold hydrolase [Fodinicola feengrottensis]
MSTRLRQLLTRRRLVPVIVVLVLVAAAITWLAWPAGGAFHRVPAMVAVQTGPGGRQTRRAGHHDVRAGQGLGWYAGASGVAGAWLWRLKAERGRRCRKKLAGQGYLVVTWSAEGFGASGGRIHLDSPDYEVSDASRLIDRLAARTDVIHDRGGDPRVAVVGGSYGGALALLLAADDHRVDAVVAQITWNDLGKSFFPNAAGGPAASGVFKKLWAGLFFSTGMTRRDSRPAPTRARRRSRRRLPIRAAAGSPWIFVTPICRRPRLGSSARL